MHVIKQVYNEKHTPIDRSQNPPTLSYCCHDRKTMLLSHYTMFSRSEKYIAEKRGNWQQTEKTEQVTSDMKQGLRTLSF